MLQDRVWFLRFLVLKQSIIFAPFDIVIQCEPQMGYLNYQLK